MILSSLTKKIIISLSGLFLLVFLALHLVLNLTAICSREWYEAVCEFMDTNIAIKLMVPVLVLGFVIHLAFATAFEFKNWAARPRELKYAVATHTKGVSWSAKNMFVLGIVVILGIVLHLFNFWSKMQLQGFLGNEEENAYDLVVNLFSCKCFVLIYAIWIIAIFFHVQHGFWSAFQSIGLNNSKWLPRLQFLSKVYAWIILIGYLSIPICFTLGLQCS